MATIQISSVQRLVFESRKFCSGKTNSVKISKKTFLWYGKVNFCVETMLNMLNQGKAFLGACGRPNTRTSTFLSASVAFRRQGVSPAGPKWT